MDSDAPAISTIQQDWFQTWWLQLKILCGVQGWQNIHHQLLEPRNLIMMITKSCCWLVLDDRLEVQNNLSCTNIGFGITAMSREEEIWIGGKVCHLIVDIMCHLIVDISRFRASCCTAQSPLPMWAFDPRYKDRKDEGFVGRKQKSILESGVWTYISFDW